MKVMRVMIWPALVLLVVATSSDSQPAPNVLILLVDDLGVGDLGCYGNTSLLTPHMDSLARYWQLSTVHYTCSCREGARLLALLPAAHGSSAWVRATLGKCHFEMNEYKEACGYFSLVREQDPYRLELMEYYSTALWHLQEEVQLSALAQDLQRIDKFSAAAWCAAGNCFSHQKEHENAIKFFQRAVQVSLQDREDQLGDSSPPRSAPTSPTPSPCWGTSTCWWRSWRRHLPASGR